jgi:putative ABC transport system ATP-binding protein
MNPILEFRSVERRFKDGDDLVYALRDASFSIDAGEFVAVMGPSGSGKSTLLNLAGGLDEPTAGHVSVDGIDLASLDVRGLATVRRQTVGYIFQKLNLLPTLTVVENVMLPLELDGTSARAARAAARAALGEMAIAALADRYPDDISGGQQQRVAIARAIVGNRRLLLADEPTGALDTVTGESVMELLTKQVVAGRTVVLVTHEPRFASFADRVLMVRDGNVVENAGVVAALRPAPLSDLWPSSDGETDEAAS